MKFIASSPARYCKYDLSSAVLRAVLRNTQYLVCTRNINNVQPDSRTVISQAAGQVRHFYIYCEQLLSVVVVAK